MHLVLRQWLRRCLTVSGRRRWDSTIARWILAGRRGRDTRIRATRRGSISGTHTKGGDRRSEKALSGACRSCIQMDDGLMYLYRITAWLTLTSPRGIFVFIIGTYSVLLPVSPNSLYRVVKLSATLLLVPLHMNQMTSGDSIESASPSPSRRKPPIRRIWDYLQTDVDPKACNYVSVFACFLTGMTACISFSACYVW